MDTYSTDWYLNEDVSEYSDDNVQVIVKKKGKQTDKTPKRSRMNKSTSKRSKKVTPQESKSLLDTLETSNVEITSEETRDEEEARKKRVAEKQALLNSVFGTPGNTKKLVLDYDANTNDALVTVHPKLVDKLKPHQVAGITFMWNACFESLERIEEGKGGGCILAHCMGLGKTFQVVTLVHTLLSHSATKVNNVLILCPVNTLLNWKAEFQKWLTDLDDCNINIYDVTKASDNIARAEQLVQWMKSGGVMIFGYEMFRTLINNENIATNTREKIIEALLNPGPDLVVCDEGHVLKNEKSAISKTIMLMKSLRRIILTGTPLQNNLMEYFCMVQFVKPKLLGTKKEFQNLFAHPISKGQFQNSEAGDVNVMKERSFVLHRLLDGIVQRFNSNELKPYLPPKHEFVILIALSDLQAELYEHYIRNISQISQKTKKESGTKLLNDYQNMRMIWTHPMAMKLSFADKRSSSKMDDSEDEYSDSFELDDCDFGKLNKNSSLRNPKEETVRSQKTQRKPLRSIKNVIDIHKSVDVIEIGSSTDSESDTRSSFGGKSKNGRGSDPKNDSRPWWNDLISDADFKDYNKGPKLTLLFAILKQCQQTGEKILIFSQSLSSLDMIEYFLAKESDPSKSTSFIGTWIRDIDYFRLDGKTTKEKRAGDCRIFNDPLNTRARLFLISTKAGGLGINLTTATRVIIFDVSWNPSNDVQSIFRVYRFGQTKPCYIYRFVSQGTMEQKMYERQVTKISVARRVIDEEQIDRHFTQEEVGDLYAFERLTKPSYDVPEFPNDHLLAGLLKKYPNLILNYLKHDSLLENADEEELTDAERLQAWRQYEYELATSAEDVVTSEQLIRSSLKELNPKLSKPKLEKEMNMVRDRLMKFIKKEQNEISADPNIDVRQSLSRNSFSYSSPVGTNQRPMYSMTVSKTTAGITLQNGVGAIPISEDPELAIKQLALLHYLQHKVPDDDLFWRPLETPCTYKLYWSSSTKDPKSLIKLFQEEFSHWKKKPKFTVVGQKVLLHLRFCPKKITLQERLLRYGVQVEWVANDLDAAEALLKTRFTNVQVNVVQQPKAVVKGTLVEPETKELLGKVLDGGSVSSNSTLMETMTESESNEESLEISEFIECSVLEPVEVDSMCEEIYEDLIVEVEEVYEDDYPDVV